MSESEQASLSYTRSISTDQDRVVGAVSKTLAEMAYLEADGRNQN